MALILFRLYRLIKLDEKDDIIFQGAIPINKHLIRIGERVSFGGNVVLYAVEPIEIGNDTLIAINVVIHTATHNYNNHPMWLQRIDAPVKIGSNVWIGVGAIILPGVIIEDYAVIAAGSVIVDNVPRGAIVAGNPGRIIKFRNFQGLNENFDIKLYPGEVIKSGHKIKYCKLSKG